MSIANFVTAVRINAGDLRQLDVIGFVFQNPPGDGRMSRKRVVATEAAIRVLHLHQLVLFMRE